MEKTNLEIYRPFGPSIGRCILPKELVNDFNNDCDDIVKNNKTKERDWSQYLVGNVKQELLISPKTFTKWSKFFEEVISKYFRYHLVGENLKRLRYKSGWYVRQFAGDFNPSHFHGDCHLSCVGYLKLPDGIEEEWKNEDKYHPDKHHHPSSGYIEMTYGQTHQFSENVLKMRPTVGDYYLFPWWMYHCVYPFRSKGERRSFSFNVYGDTEVSAEAKARKQEKDIKSRLII